LLNLAAMIWPAVRGSSPPLPPPRAPGPTRTPAPAPSLAPTQTATVSVDWAAVTGRSLTALPLRPVPPAFQQMVRAGGGSDVLAERMWHDGIDADTAQGLMALPVSEAGPGRFGPQRVLMELLARAVEAQGLTPEAVQATLHQLQHAVVVRPDGIVVRAMDDAPLERRTLSFDGTTLRAGRLEVGALYTSTQGVLRSIEPDGTRGPVVDELGLVHEAANAFLDGVEDVARESILGIGALVEGLATDPAGTVTKLVQGLLDLPEAAVRLAIDLPGLAASLVHLPAEERWRAAGRVVSTALLAARAAQAVGTAARTLGGAPPKVSLSLARFAHAPVTLPILQVEGGAITLAELGAAGRQGAAALGGPLYRVLEGDPSDPKVRWANDDHVIRTLKDPRVEQPSIPDLEAGLELAKAEFIPNSQLSYARMLVQALEARAGGVHIEDAARLMKASQGLAPQAAAELQAWVGRQFRAAVKDLEGLAPSRRQARVQELRQLADEAKLNLHKAFRSFGPARPLASLSPEAQAAVVKIQAGAPDVHVSSRAVAEEVLSQFPDLAETTGWPKSQTKGLFKRSFEKTYHWDEVLGPDGRVVGHPDAHGDLPHLQLEDANGKKGTVRITFPPPETTP
jgi:hypothetical protein